MAKLMIYGATGYTGRLASQYAKSLESNFIVSGRKEIRVRDLALSLGVGYRVFNVDEQQDIDSALEGITVLLNCAGPFMRTAKSLMNACIRNGTHYLDIAAELDSYRIAEDLDEEAVQANVMLMPGCGGSVAMLGCLIAYATKHIKNPTSVDIALHIAGSMSRGSAISATDNLTAGCLQRQGGLLVPQESGAIAKFNFGDGKGSVSSFPVTLPDLITIWKSTNVANIRTFVHVSGNAFPSGDISSLPDGPTDEQRGSSPYHAAASITADDGTVTHAVLHTVNGYTFTFMASVEAAKRVLAGEYRSGFQTPAGLFGEDFVRTVAGSKLAHM